MYRDTTLRYIVKASDAVSAAESAGQFKADSVNPCFGKDMEGCFEVCITLGPADLERLLGKPTKGVSFREAARMALEAEKAHEARMKKMESDSD